MEKLKIAKLLNSEQAIKELTLQPLPIDYTKELLDFIKAVSSAVNEFKNTNNQMVIDKYGVNTDGKWEIDPEKFDEYKGEVIPMLEKEIECEVPKLSIAKIKECNERFCLSTVALTNLENFLIYE